MGKYGLQAHIRKAFVRTTDSAHGLPVYPNLIAGMTVTDINQVWASDITYVRIATGFVYVAIILDLFSRRIVGWAISKSLDRRFTLEALKMAIEQRNPQAGIIHHSDQGVQYACQEYVELLTASQFLISMSRSGNPYDNAFAESFMKTLKRRRSICGSMKASLTLRSVSRIFLEDVYNRKRVHSGIKYLSPVQFEAILADEKRRKTTRPDQPKNLRKVSNVRGALQIL